MQFRIKGVFSRVGKSQADRRADTPGAASHLTLGQRGETAAAKYLKDGPGYRIVATNFTLLLGRSLGGRKITGEIDIIAYDDDTLVFVEVKTRTSDEVAAPEASVGLRKQRQIARAARRYRQLMHLMDEKYRYDVVTALVEESEIKVELIKGYFDDSVFLRGRYFGKSSEF